MLKTAKFVTALLVAALLVPGMVHAQAESDSTGYQNDGKSSGLSISAPNPAADIGNLNPGDKKSSSLLLVNTGQYTLTVYMKTEIDDESAPNGGSLADGMKLTVSDGNAYLAQGIPFRTAASDNSVLVGTMAPGARKTLDFNVDLPGEGTGNRYQGASMQVKWVFTTVYSSASSSGGGGGGGDRGRTNGGPSLEIISAESVPTVTPIETVSVPDETTPKASPVTGERSVKPLLIVGTAAGMIAAAGILLLRKRRQS